MNGCGRARISELKYHRGGPEWPVSPASAKGWITVPLLMGVCPPRVITPPDLITVLGVLGQVSGWASVIDSSRDTIDWYPIDYVDSERMGPREYWNLRTISCYFTVLQVSLIKITL